jgi:hypothetical protein
MATWIQQQWTLVPHITTQPILAKEGIVGRIGDAFYTVYSERVWDNKYYQAAIAIAEVAEQISSDGDKVGASITRICIYC